MSHCIDSPMSRPLKAPTLLQLAGRLWRQLILRRRLDTHLMSVHMLRDLGLPDRIAEDPLAREKLRQFF